MKHKVLAALIIVSMIFAVQTPSVFAVGASEASASLFLPTTGQAMNGQLGATKSKTMAGIEIAGVTTLAILGGVVGGPVIWAALGPLIANHVWSSVDAYKGAQHKIDPAVQQQMMEAQRTLDYSRQRRYEREQIERNDARERIRMAGEQAGAYVK